MDETDHTKAKLALRFLELYEHRHFEGAIDVGDEAKEKVVQIRDECWVIISKYFRP